MKKLFIAFLFFAPSFVFASVRINEIAWMGDSLSSDHEWVELYNDDDTPQDLTGWKFTGTTDTDGDIKEKFSISVSGTISGNGYFLVENKRSKNDTAPYLSSDFASVSFSLINSGEILRLIKADGTISDEVKSPFKTKWEKGDNTSKETMQRNGSGWITALATPKAENKNIDTDAIKASTDETLEDPVNESSTLSDTSAHMSPLSLSDFSQKQEVYISAGRDRIVSVGSPVIFEAYAIDEKGSKVKDISSVWSFGDGSQSGGMKVLHTYKYPGDYAVILNASAGGNEAVSRSKVRIFSPKISLEAEDDGAISLENTSEYEVNIGSWKIVGGTASFVFSPDTIIGQGKKIIFPKDITGIDLSFSESLKLMSPCGIVFSEFVKKEKPAAVAISSTTPAELLLPSIPKKSEPSAVSSASFSESREAPVTITSQPEKSSGIEETTGREPQTITLKKPEGFLTKMWHFFFK